MDRKLPVINSDCGDGSCGCGCGFLFVKLEAGKQGPPPAGPDIETVADPDTSKGKGLERHRSDDWPTFKPV